MTRLALLSAQVFLTLFTATTLINALAFDAAEDDWNLNKNRLAANPIQYKGNRDPSNHDYFKSPKNWRFPFYTLFIDRFVNGDPTNDNINGTLFETDMMSTQLRFGGDLAGLMDSLDYIKGMGIKVGSPICWRIVRLADSAVGSLYCGLTVHQSAVGCGFVLCRSHVSMMGGGLLLTSTVADRFDAPRQALRDCQDMARGYRHDP